mmetsp:Transcript_16082/g.15485  ORF Transcript_16082/g.15485 Transcript_16082/m.15485 type:complete len:138 (-) Transcript_16082:368-781(-)
MFFFFLLDIIEANVNFHLLYLCLLLLNVVIDSLQLVHQLLMLFFFVWENLTQPLNFIFSLSNVFFYQFSVLDLFQHFSSEGIDTFLNLRKGLFVAYFIQTVGLFHLFHLNNHLLAFFLHCFKLFHSNVFIDLSLSFL